MPVRHLYLRLNTQIGKSLLQQNARLLTRATCKLILLPVILHVQLFTFHGIIALMSLLLAVGLLTIHDSHKVFVAPPIQVQMAVAGLPCCQLHTGLQCLAGCQLHVPCWQSSKHFHFRH